MEARLVQIDGERRIATLPIEEPEFRIGRDPDSDLPLDFARVSRSHALVRELGDRHVVVDLGSTNGTTLNGNPVGDTPLLLEAGDVIELANQVALVYEVGPFRSARPWIVAAALMVALLLGIAGYALWQPEGSDPIFLEATALAEQGREAALQGDAPLAKRRLREAAGLLFRQGHLDDVDRADVMRVAMERLGARIEGGEDLWALFQTSLEASKVVVPPPPAGEEAPVGCRLDAVPASQLEPCLRERIEFVLVGLRQDPSNIPEDFPTQVGRRIAHEHRLLEASLERGKKVVPMMSAELEHAKLPPLLHYLALVESGYDPAATSPAAAAGLWQFMPGTARQYGLRVSGRVDERRDPVKSTRAAARYLRDLAFEFGGDALLLALAGYNRGENGVRRALKKLDDPFSDRSYWRLVERGLLPDETAKYVTRFVAAAVVGEAGLPSKDTLAEAGYDS